ncbi:MobF family relaxase [Acrocarpospora catenulata]|uniref:MobF family relaxase n=1 Tax=Acrocarpospora catenulata TaxID=2836182 RepID=UPI001BD91C09|nr:MobF family relaxase [Acrocarpospora catenulata]
MAWVSVIGPSQEQVEYRLQEGAGCGHQVRDPDRHAELAPGAEHDHPDVRPDGQVAYRLAGDRGLMWIGQGLHEVGITPLTTLTPGQHDAARAIMDGADPRDGQVLLAPKQAVDPRAKLGAAPLLEALEEAAVLRGLTGGAAALLADHPALVKRAARLARGVARQGEAHRLPIRDAERLAVAAGIDLADLYPADELALARRWRDAMVRVGNRGYDLTLDVTKSLSGLHGLATLSAPRFAAAIKKTFAEAVIETVAAVEQWAAYGQRGHQGDGQLAKRAESTGLLGWVMWHDTARPVGDAAPDPHLHAHVVIANLVRGREDGKWSAIGAGGRDIYRHAHAADALLKARLRRELTQTWGITWARDPDTGAWELQAIPAHVRALFSKRASQVRATLARLGIAYDQASGQARKLASTQSRQAKSPVSEQGLAADWHAQLAAVGIDGHALVDACRDSGPDPGTGPAGLAGPGGPGPVLPERPAAEEIAAWIWRPDGGLTAHAKEASRADVLAAVIDTCPDGVADLADAEALTDQVLALAPAVRRPDSGATHLTNSQRYTSQDILDAEKTILASVRDRYGAGWATVDEQAARLAITTYETGNGLTLSDEQRAVLDRLLTGGHGVEAVIGVAGAGKTTIMAAARTAWSSRGLVVAGAATAAVAAAHLYGESGIPATTIASWLARIQDGPGLSGVDVLVVDEAAMVDDRELAVLLTEAGRTGTKLVLIGDPVQLRAVGVGGGFAAIHRQVDGALLSENRRQRDPLERAALELWRAGERRQALQTWGQGGRVHAGRDADDTLAAMLANWIQARQTYHPVAPVEPCDVAEQGELGWPAEFARQDAERIHDELGEVLLLSGTNEAADRLNAAARAIRRARGELDGPDRRYLLPGGKILALAVGDHVRVRRNDYRSARGEGLDVLNGYRGRIASIGGDRRVEVEWRSRTADGPRLVREWISPDYIAAGGLTHGTAMTVAAAQGLTAEHALIYGLGLDPHTLYAAMARDRQTARLYLPRDLLESDADRARHGQARTPGEELQRALAAYAATLDGDRADRLLTPEPDPIATPAPVGEGQGVPGEPARDPDRAAHPEQRAEAARTAEPRDRDVQQVLERERRANLLLPLMRVPHGLGLVDDQQLADRIRCLAADLQNALAELVGARLALARTVEHGGGRAERTLDAKVTRLRDQVAAIERAEADAARLAQARATITTARRQAEELRSRHRQLTGELEGLTSWRPGHRARRRELEAELPAIERELGELAARTEPVSQARPALAEAARASTAQAPPAATWPMVRAQHDGLTHDIDAARRAARAADVTTSNQAVQAAQARRDVAAERRQAAIDEQSRRAGLDPVQRDEEQAVRRGQAEKVGARASVGREVQGADRPSRSRRYVPPSFPGRDGPGRAFGR